MQQQTRPKQSFDDCPQQLRSFLYYMLTIKGRSARTVDAYYIDIRTFFRFLVQQKKLMPNNDTPFEDLPIKLVTLDVLRTVTLSDAYEFLNFLLDERSNSARTRARKISALKTFFHYLVDKQHLLDNNPIAELEAPSIKNPLPKYLTLEEATKLLESIDGKYKERNFCIATFFLNCGMRLSELCGIDLRDIQQDTLRLLGKGNKERVVYLNDACLSALNAYLPVRAAGKIFPPDKDALFLNRDGKRLSARRVEQIITAQLQKSGILKPNEILNHSGYSVHKLRHTAATIMYQHGGVDIRILQEILGHESLGTTQIYTHISSEQMKKAAASTPLSRIKPAKKQEKSDTPKEETDES